MTSGTALERRSTLDLTRSPSEQWNQEMLDVITRNVFRNLEITQPQLYYCLSVAESLGLNPMIGEIYFIPGKSRDGKGPAWQPYIGRNGLVKKAAERGCYYESETVHANDRFRMSRGRDGEIKVTHSYGSKDRGEIVGAYAFLHDEGGRRKPAFFYAKLDEYLPTFDADWKMDASPWGNQRSAMIEKCAMIGAGRKRLDLGNVLADGEVARYQQMGEAGPSQTPQQVAPAPDWPVLTADPELQERVRLAATSAGWPAAKAEMVLTGKSDDELREIAEQLEQGPQAAQEPIRATDHSGDEAERVARAVREREGGAEAAVVDAVVVPDAEHVEALRRRLAGLEDDLNDPELTDDQRGDLVAEHEQVQSELAAAENPDQLSLG